MSISNDRSRRSAKQVIQELTGELLTRPSSPENEAKLVLIETIASRMSWLDIFNRIRFRKRYQEQVWMPYKD